MKQDHEIYEGLRRAVNHVTPDIFDRISSQDISLEERREVIRVEATAPKKTKRFKALGGLVAACLVIGVSFGGMQYANNYAKDSVISIDVNPSVQLITNKSDKVLEAIALNPDGKIVLDGMNLAKVDLDVAINALTGSMVKQGFLVEGSASVLVSVQNKNPDRAAALTDIVTTDFTNAMNENNLNGAILSQAISDTSNTNVEDFAKKHGISYGKAIFVYKLMEKDSSLSADKLADLSLKEISVLVRQKNIDIRDIVQYDHDDSIQENIEEGIEDINEQRYGDDDDIPPVNASQNSNSNGTVKQNNSANGIVKQNNSANGNGNQNSQGHQNDVNAKDRDWDDDDDDWEDWDDDDNDSDDDLDDRQDDDLDDDDDDDDGSDDND